MQLPNMQGRSPIFRSKIKQKEIEFIISILDIPEDKTLLIEYEVFYFKNACIHSQETLTAL